MLLLLLGVLNSTLIRFPVFLVVFGITILYMMPGYRIFRVWLDVILRLLPFFISYFLFGLLVDLPFPIQLNFACRMLFLLLLSLYLLKTTTLNQFLADSGKWRQKAVFRPLFFYLVSTLQFLPVFGKENKEMICQVKQKGKLSIAASVDVLVQSFVNTWDKVPVIEEKTRHRLQQEFDRHPFFTYANLMLYLLITVYILAAAF
jgi:hypothetical protein